MPRKPIPEPWRRIVKAVLTKHDGKISVRQLFRQVQSVAGRLGTSDDPKLRALAKEYPSERTISRIKEVEWPLVTEQQVAEYRAFHWPESMGTAELPWEAGASALELLGYLTRPPMADTYGRPSVQVVKWFCRLSLAGPNMELETRHLLARDFALWELLGSQEGAVRGYETYLAWAPWSSEVRRQEYEKAVDESTIPGALLVFPTSPSSFTREQWKAVLDQIGDPTERYKPR